MLSGTYLIFLVVPSVSLCIRRLHNFRASGWWFLTIFLPVANAILLVFLFFKSGLAGPNRYGRDPRRIDPPFR